MKANVALAGAIALGVLVRAPFWTEALRTPVDGDTAIIGLMARHPLGLATQGTMASTTGSGAIGTWTTMWGQPYGSPVEGWLAAPFVAAFGPTTEALRLFYFLLGLALIPLAFHLAKALHPGAAAPAAVLVACPPPYLLLLAALPPPLYPTALALGALVLLLALRLGERLRAGEYPRVGLIAWGSVSGLALWTHLMSASAVAAGLAFLWWCARGKRWRLASGVVPVLVTSAPAWLPSVRGGTALSILKVVGRQEGFGEHLAAVLPQLHRPLAGLFGIQVPLIADSPEFLVSAPGWAAAGLTIVYCVALFFAARAGRSSQGALLLLGAAALALCAFPLPVRSGPASIRFLTPMYLPVTVTIVWVAVHLGSTRRAWVVTLSLAVMHLSGGARLLDAWRLTDRAQAPFLLPDLRPIQRVLESHGIRRAYASYGPAYRLTYESGERVIVSQPWNERFLHYPLPYLDEVRFAKNVAWVLTPSVPTDLPNPRAFESALGTAGGTWRRTDAGTATIYHAFEPPFGPQVSPLAEAGIAGDGDVGTVLRPARDGPTTWTFAEPMALDAVTLVAGQAATTDASAGVLLRSMDVEVSTDGVAFEPVARRRRRGEREDLRWVNGQPQYVLDHDLLAVPLGGRTVQALRVTPVASLDPWTIGEILIHPAQAVREGWEEWMDPNLDWPARALFLAAHPLRDREDWYYRLLLARRVEQR